MFMKLTVKIGIVAMCILFIPGCITLQVKSVKAYPSTLKNLPPVLVVAHDLNDKTPRTLVDVGELGRSVERQLSDGGVQIINVSIWKVKELVEHPWLVIEFATFQLESSAYAHYVQLRLSQIIQVKTDAGEKTVTATIYELHGPIAVSNRMSSAVLRNSVGPLVDEFINDYKLANQQ